MKDIILKVPDEFTDEQVETIKKSAIAQIEAEIRQSLAIPRVDIDACDEKISDVREANS